MASCSVHFNTSSQSRRGTHLEDTDLVWRRPPPYRWAFWRAWSLLFAWWFGLYLPPDRRLLERVILPYYGARRDVRRLLFVGVSLHTRKYSRYFPNAEYVTLDANPRMRRFGARRHIIDRLEHIERHVPPRYFDLMVINGVIGWGLNGVSAVDQTLASCGVCLADGGELVLGLNERVPSSPPVSGLTTLSRFQAVAFPPLGAHRHVVATPFAEKEHSFFFYRQPPRVE